MEGIKFLMKYFKLEESPYYNGKLVIKPVYEKLGIKYIGKGSYNLLPARLFGLSYANYLRMCRDLYGATIKGKGHKYPIAYFTTQDGRAQKLVEELNMKVKFAVARK